MQTVKKNKTALITALIIILVIIGATLYSRQLAAPQEPGVNPAPQPAAVTPDVSNGTPPLAALPATPPPVSTAGSAQSWTVVQGESRLGFEGDYSGSGFSGQFPRFTAVIHFDPEQLDASSFDVSVDATSVTTFNADWDSNLGSQDWFYFSRYPQATYVTSAFRRLEGQEFLATGTLDLKGHQGEVELRFTWTQTADGGALLEGQAKLLGDAEVNRRDFRIGDGDWYEDSTIGFKVLVKVSLLLEKSPP